MNLTEIGLDEASDYPVRKLSALLQCAGSLFLVPKETILNGKNEVVLTHSLLVSEECRSLLSALMLQHMSANAKRTEVKTALKALNDGCEHNQVKRLQTVLKKQIIDYDKVVVDRDNFKDKWETSEENVKVFKGLLEGEIADHRRDKALMEDERTRNWKERMYKLKLKHEAQLALPPPFSMPKQTAEVQEIDSTGDVSDPSDLIRNFTFKQTK